MFPRLDPDVHKISDDQQLVIDLLEQQHLLLTHGTGFDLDTPTTCGWCSWPGSTC